MDKFNTRTMSFISIILVICFIFVMVINQAFKYLPQETNDNNTSVAIEEQANNDEERKEVVNKDENVAEQDEISEEELDKPVTKIKQVATAPEKPLEIISDEELIEEKNISEVAESTTDFINKNLENARVLKNNKQYSEALNEYDKIIKTTDNIKIKATCYEESAVVFGILKRYGSALAAAQRAYNMAPTSYREMLLARLYYKTGDLNKATARVNNVLKRDFDAND